MIKKENGEWFVFSESGKKLSHGYKTKDGAKKRLGQIEYFKKKKRG